MANLTLILESTGARAVTGGRMPFCLIALAVTPLLHAVTMAEPPPNVAPIVCDDQAWFHFGFMGNREIHTPNLDRLAEQSAVFTRGYVPTSVCRPSLATIVTGRYPHEQHNVAAEQPDRVRRLRAILDLWWPAT